MKKYLEQLFISKVRIKILRYFYTHPQEKIHLRGVVRELKEEINAIRRELGRLEKIGLLYAETKGNRKYFQLNSEFMFYDELLHMVSKSFGIGADIINAKKKLGVEIAVMTQGLIRNNPIGKHNIDLVLVGENIEMQELKKIIEKEEQRLGRDIYYAVLPPDDFHTRKRRRDIFVQELFMQELLILVGSSTELYSGLDI